MGLCKYCDEPLTERGGLLHCAHCDEPCKLPRGSCGHCALGNLRAKRSGYETP